MVIGSSSVGIQRVDWCNFCNARPASGKLLVELDGLEDEPVWLPACQYCAAEALDNLNQT